MINKATVYKPYKPWDEIKKEEAGVQNASNKDLIISYNKSNGHDNYAIVDKKACRLNVYSPNGVVIKSFEVGRGDQKGDDNLSETRRMTTAGIYTITAQGNGRDDYADTYGKNIFVMQTDKGSTGVSIHQIPNGNTSREPKHNNGNLADNRYSNGCINLTKKDHEKLQKYIGKNSHVYILPEDNNNKFMVKNGQLNFTQKKYTGTVYTSKPSNKAYPIRIVNKNSDYDSNSSKKFSQALIDKKSEIMSSMGLDNDSYNDLAQLSLGIAGQETKYGNALSYALKPDWLVSSAKWVLGDHSYNSRGITQIKINGIRDKNAEAALKKFGITEDTIDNPKNSAIATMILLASMKKK